MQKLIRYRLARREINGKWEKKIMDSLLTIMTGPSEMKLNLECFCKKTCMVPQYSKKLSFSILFSESDLQSSFLRVGAILLSAQL